MKAAPSILRFHVCFPSLEALVMTTFFRLKKIIKAKANAASSATKKLYSFIAGLSPEKKSKKTISPARQNPNVINRIRL